MHFYVQFLVKLKMWLNYLPDGLYQILSNYLCVVKIKSSEIEKNNKNLELYGHSYGAGHYNNCIYLHSFLIHHKKCGGHLTVVHKIEHVHKIDGHEVGLCLIHGKCYTFIPKCNVLCSLNYYFFGIMVLNVMLFDRFGNLHL